MAKSKKIRISIIQLVYLAYIIRLITGRSLRDLVTDLLAGGGNITDKVIDLALSVLERIEAEGLEIAVNAVVVTWVKNQVTKVMGHKTLIDLGFAVLTV